jgi:RNA polymerase sigma-70 factor (ECF subfamily)
LVPPAIDQIDQAEAFARLLSSAEPRIRAHLRCQILNRADADDVFQETASTLWSKFSEFKQGTNFNAWAMEVARYKILQYYQRRPRNQSGLSQASLEAVAAESDELTVSIGDTVAALRQCLQKLPGADRRILMLCYEPHATVRGVAERLGQPFGTINSKVQRSRRALYECIQRALARVSHP